MMRSIFSAISGLRTHQTMLDVVGNNIANINTNAFKAARITFQDILSQTVRGGSGATAASGGSNPAQVGLGVAVGAVDTIHNQGNLQATGKDTDLAIQGAGYFVLSNGSQNFYSRDGAFGLATDGTLVNPSNGFRVLGWNGSKGVVDTSGPLAAISLPLTQGVSGQVSASVALKGNLNRDAAAPFATTITTFDATGGQHRLTLTFTKTGANAWSVAPTIADTDGTTVSGSAGSLAFDSATGSLPAPGPTNPPAPIKITVTPPAASGAAPHEVTLDYSKMTQLASDSEVTATTDGAPPGSLVSFSIGTSGEVAGIYSNGLKRTLAQVALGTFANPSGLLKTGNNLYTVSANSGEAQVGSAGRSGRGEVNSGFLETSNVDLAQQFTNMIMAERGFQANSRVITASDEMLQDLVNLKR